MEVVNDRFAPLHFIDEPIGVIFDTPPVWEKKPECPQGFTWRGETYRIVEMLAEWVDFGRRGTMENNMAPEHAQVARIRGSWGVGRFFFQVKIESGQVFQIYYDRAPKDVDNRKGNWILLGEYSEQQRS